MHKETDELKKWNVFKKKIGEEQIILGPYFSYQLRNTPRRILFALSHYKFAAKMIGEGKQVLEIGCSEGVGTVLLAEFAKRVVALDIDEGAIMEATRNFASEKVEFLCGDILENTIGNFDAAVSFDVIEHIYPENEERFLEAISRNLTRTGICIIGTPNQTSDCYANEITRMGHVNLYTWDRLKDSMSCYFEQVFIFSANDEIVHTGFYPMANYLIGVGVGKKVL